MGIACANTVHSHQQPTTPKGRDIVARLTETRDSWAVQADDDEAPSYHRLAAVSRRDCLTEVLSWLPTMVLRAEQEAADIELDPGEHEWEMCGRSAADCRCDCPRCQAEHWPAAA